MFHSLERVRYWLLIQKKPRLYAHPHGVIRNISFGLEPFYLMNLLLHYFRPSPVSFIFELARIFKEDL